MAKRPRCDPPAGRSVPAHPANRGDSRLHGRSCGAGSTGHHQFPEPVGRSCCRQCSINCCAASGLGIAERCTTITPSWTPSKSGRRHNLKSTSLRMLGCWKGCRRRILADPAGLPSSRKPTMTASGNGVVCGREAADDRCRVLTQASRSRESSDRAARRMLYRAAVCSPCARSRWRSASSSIRRSSAAISSRLLTGIDDQGVVLMNGVFMNAALRGQNHGAATGHGFQPGAAKGLVVGKIHENFGVAVQPARWSP